MPIVNLPGCPVQPDNLTETLMQLVLRLVHVGPDLDLDEQGRPRWLFERTAHDGCDRAGFYETRAFAARPGDDGPCLVKLGCSGPVVKCNVPVRGWVNGIGGCPNVGGICMACTMPGFPDKFMPFMESDGLGRLAAHPARFTYGPALRYLRERAIRRNVRRRAGMARPQRSAGKRPLSAETAERRGFRVTGTVQGVGFRPFVYGLAGRHGLAGFVLQRRRRGRDRGRGRRRPRSTRSRPR